MEQHSQCEKDYLIKKHERTMKLREEFIKQNTNPYHGHGDFFDPNLTRFHAMRDTFWNNFKPTPTTFGSAMGLVILPIIFFAWALKSERDRREQKYRTGQVAYKDRSTKFI